ncbi:MAG: sugar transferase [Bacteroidales bacterium]|nr:sugar transferase [Bacteroidales bacterium]
MNKKVQTAKYVVWDVFAAIVAWAIFFFYRKISIERELFEDVNQVFADSNFWWGIFLLPAAWCALYIIQGTYRNVYRKARLKELQMTFWASLLGVIVIFFALLLDDAITSYRNYYASFAILFVLHFSLTYVGRLCITSRTARKIHTRRIGFPTLLVGSKEKAYATYKELDEQAVYSGNLFVGFITVNGHIDPRLQEVMPHLGDSSQINQLIERYNIEEVIFAIEDYEKDKINEIIRILDRRDDVIIKITPDLRDIVYGSVKLSSIFHSPLITFNPRPMEEWQYSVKRLADIVFSMLALLLLSPVFLFTALMVKFSSPGPIFYAQERIGYRGKPFKMHKFRSMYVDAEAAGPALSKDDDPRITPFGRIMRKYRLDEIPQFYNVLKGTMSLVGPRPERQYFIDQIVERAPEYLLLQKVKPGITSWGQVKYGYAENVDEMVERLRYDLLYLENMSLATDIKILLYTVIIIIQGRGK